MMHSLKALFAAGTILSLLLAAPPRAGAAESTLRLADVEIALHMVPDGRKTAAGLPRSSATISQRRFTLGSSPRCSSPTGASLIAARMGGVGRVCVSL